MQRIISAHYLHYPTPNSRLSGGMPKRHRPRSTSELSQVSHGRVIRNSDYSYYLCFIVSVRTNKLIYSPPYSKRQECLHTLIKYLHDEREMGYRKISQFLNKSGIKTQRDKTFSNPSVHSILKRKKQREERIEKVRNKRYESSMGKMSLEFLRN